MRINYVGKSKDVVKRLPQLYSNDAITFFTFLCVSLYQEFFLMNRLREYVLAIIVSIMAKFEQIL